MSRAVASFLALLFFCTVATQAVACTCERPSNLNSLDAKQKWLFERAIDVVRGRITEVRANRETLRDGQRVLVATMKATSVLKGDVPLGDLTIVSTFGESNCGIPMFLLQNAAADHDVDLEVRKVAERPKEFTVSLCGYGNVLAGGAQMTPVR